MTPSFSHPAPPATYFSNYLKGCPVLVPAGPRFSICYNRATVEQTDAVGIIRKEQETGITYIKRLQYVRTRFGGKCLSRVMQLLHSRPGTVVTGALDCSDHSFFTRGGSLVYSDGVDRPFMVHHRRRQVHPLTWLNRRAGHLRCAALNPTKKPTPFQGRLFRYMAPVRGFEPLTTRLTVECATVAPHRNNFYMGVKAR